MTDVYDTPPGSLRDSVLRRKNALWLERSPWLEDWREVSRTQQPRLGRFMVTARNKPNQSRHNSIIDNTGVRASATLAAGMMSGMTSPARPWFKMDVEDDDLREFQPAKRWLHDVNNRMLRIFARSNTYRALHSCYEELGLFGTWCDFVQPNFDNVIHHQAMTIGEYALAVNDLGYVDTVCREFQMTVGQMVQKFGINAVSPAVKNLYDRRNLDAWVDVIHLVDPRHQRDERKGNNRNMPWRSIYIEPGKDNWDNRSMALSESGFRRFPALAPRWAATSGDVYGNSPGMECLGDVKSLQFNQRRKAQGIDYMTNPPLQVPTALKGRHLDRLPGGVSYYDGAGPGSGVRSMFEVNLNLSDLREDILDVRQRIRESYYADMFLMLANDPKGTMTATEVAERHEEKLLMLGPVLERLHNELLSPLIDMTFDRMVAAEMLTGSLEPPPELRDTELKVEFVSILAQAQKAVGARGLDRTLGVIGQMAGLWPEVTKKVNAMQVVDEYAELYGINPEVIHDDETATAAMQAAAQAQQAQTMADSAPGMADAAKTMSEVNTDNLSSIMSNLQGYDVLSPGT